MSRCSRLFPLSSLRSGGRRPQSTTAAAAARSIDLSTPSPLIDLSQCPSTLLTQLQVQPTELLLYPNVFNQTEQDLLVQAALARLDASLSSEDRAARRAYKRRHGLAKAQGLLPDAAYGFSQSHFDEVCVCFGRTPWLLRSYMLLIRGGGHPQHHRISRGPSGLRDNHSKANHSC